jgi:type III pantothenate kinase
LNLIIDQGNSFNKIALFRHDELIDKWSLPDEDSISMVKDLFNKNTIKQFIYSSVRSNPGELLMRLKDYNPLQILVFDASTPLPIGLDYQTPKTAGTDRLANCVAAFNQFNGEDCLIVDFGTCITYSLLINKKFSGGAISPGLVMRFKALHTMTGKLPLLEAADPDILVGDSTESSIRSGVQVASTFEADAMIKAFCTQNSISNVLITGGDLLFFEPRLKSRTFANPDLTVIGLNEILEYNVQ